MSFHLSLTLLSLMARSQLAHITYISFCAGAMDFVYLAILVNTNALWSLQRGCMKCAAGHGFRLCAGAMEFVYLYC